MNIHYANLNDNSNQWIDTGANDTGAYNFSYKDGKYFYTSGNSDNGQKCQIFSSDNLLQWTKIHTSINNNFNNGNSYPQGIEIINNLILLKCGYSIATSIDNGNTWVDDLTKKAITQNLLFTSTEIIFNCWRS